MMEQNNKDIHFVKTCCLSPGITGVYRHSQVCIRITINIQIISKA
jgi:hypothetical protein